MKISHKNFCFPTAVIFYTFFTFAAISYAGTYSGGSGTAADPYKISTVADWQELIATTSDYDKQFVLLNDIDFAGADLSPVGMDTNPDSEWFEGSPFSGMVDGQGHILRNAVIVRPDWDYVGLFGCLSFGAQIRNLGVEGIAVTGRDFVGGLCGYNLGGKLLNSTSTGTIHGHDCVGGLCGINENILRRCSALGPVSGNEGVGGLCGYNYSGATLECFASGSAAGEWGIGGLCGANEGTIRDCYALGQVEGRDCLGGLAGATVGGTISFCYSAGKVGLGSGSGGLIGAFSLTPITACFWNTQTSGQTDGISSYYSWQVVGLTIAEMKMQTMFTDAAWDFVGEWVRGDNDTWRMCADGMEYPRLSWEFSSRGDLACADGVAVEDLVYLAERWLATTAESAGAADANADERVDLADLAIVSGHWMK
jgi:hypothetical protein